MKKATLVILLSTILLLSFTASIVLSVRGNAIADNGVGPAPNSGDCIPDGSQWGPGPAPSAGDGEQEGPEWPDWPS